MIGLGGFTMSDMLNSSLAIDSNVREDRTVAARKYHFSSPVTKGMIINAILTVTLQLCNPNNAAAPG
jgi:hypothetical protein